MIAVRKLLVLFITLAVPALFVLHFALDSKAALWVIYLFLLACFFYVSLTYGWRLAVPHVHLAFLVFFLVLAASTAIPLFRDNAPTAFLQLKALAAAFVLMSVFLTASAGIKTLADLRTALRGLDLAGVGMALSVYISAALYPAGIEFGEVQVYGGGETRTFGPLGDQVGFLLGLFVVRSLLRRHWAAFGFYLGAMILTGTRGAFVALAVAFICIGFLQLRRPAQGGRHGVLTLFIVGAISALLLFQFGDFLITRFVDEETWRQGLDSRGGSMLLGLLIFSDHPVIGLGFYAFTEAVWSYGPAAFFEVLDETLVANAANQVVQTAVDAGAIGLIALILLVGTILVRMRRNLAAAPLFFKLELRSLWVWVFAVAVGNQSAVWILPDSLFGYTVFLVAGIGCCQALWPSHTDNATVQVARAYATPG